MSKKKVIALFLTVFMLFSVIPTAFAASEPANGDQDVIYQVKNLSEAEEGALLVAFYNVVLENYDDVDELEEKVIEALNSYGYSNIIADSSSANDGIISAANFRELCEIVVANSFAVDSFHNAFNDVFMTDVYKTVLVGAVSKLGYQVEFDGNSDSISEAEVVIALTRVTQGVITEENGKLKKRRSPFSVMCNNLGIDKDGPLGLQLQSIEDEEGNTLCIDEYFVMYINKLNDVIELLNYNVDNVVYALTLYNLYDTPAPTPAPNPGTGTVVPTPTPIPVGEDPTEALNILDGVQESLGDLSGSKLANAIDAMSNGLQALVGFVLEDGEEFDGSLEDEVAENLNAIVQNVDNLVSDSQRESVVDSFNELITKSNETLSDDSKPEDVKVVSALVSKTLEASSVVINDVQSYTVAKKMTDSAIEAVNGLFENAEVGNKEAKKVMNNVIKLAEKATEKQGSKVVSVAKDSNGKLISKVSTGIINSIQARFAKVVATADAFEAELKKTDKTAKVEKKVVVKIETGSLEGEVEAQVGAGLFSKAAESKIDKVKVDAGIAALSVQPDFIDMPEGSTVAMSVDTVSLTDEQKAGLTDEQKKLVTDDAKIFDFNISLTSGTETNKVSNFNKKIEVSIPYTLAEGEDPEQITVLYLDDESGSVKNMVGTYDAMTGTVVFMTDHFSKYIVKNIKVEYSDVDPVEWYAECVNVLSAKGIINGYQGNFYPTGKVTRAEFATMVAVAKQLPLGNSTSSFPDVDEDQWYAKYVLAAADAGLVSGCPDGNFNPNDNITREQMSVLIADALGDQAPKATAKALNFKDKEEISDYAANAVAKVYKAGFIKGIGDNNFAPKLEATRAEAAVIVYLYFFYTK